MEKRKYQLGRRALSRQETRRRIVEATVALHESLGPRATTISAIAARAGVQRLTVYRHFPDDVALFRACSSHWLAGHPLPDPAIWRALDDWRSRCRAALAALYTYYRRNAGMLASVFRDADLPALAGPMQDFAEFHRGLQEDVVQGAATALARRGAFAATIRHALAFATWHALAQRFDDGELVELVMAWLEGIVASRAPRR